MWSLSRDQSIEAAAQADDSFLENVFSTVGDGLYVTDELGLVVKANPALANMLGYTQQELIGRHSVDFSHLPRIETPRFCPSCCSSC